MVFFGQGFFTTSCSSSNWHDCNPFRWIILDFGNEFTTTNNKKRFKKYAVNAVDCLQTVITLRFIIDQLSSPLRQQSNMYIAPVPGRQKVPQNDLRLGVFPKTFLSILDPDMNIMVKSCTMYRAIICSTFKIILINGIFINGPTIVRQRYYYWNVYTNLKYVSVDLILYLIPYSETYRLSSWASQPVLVDSTYFIHYFQCDILEIMYANV